MLVKLRMSFLLDGKITKTILEIMVIISCPNHSSAGHWGLLEHISWELFDNVGPSDPLKTEDNWRRSLKHLTFYNKLEELFWNLRTLTGWR